MKNFISSAYIHISLIGQTNDKFKNIFSVKNIPSINVSTWFGFPAYFNKEDSEYGYSVAIMSTHRFQHRFMVLNPEILGQ